MKTCEICSKELSDFDEVKYGKCWECLSHQEEITVTDSNIGVIRDEEQSSSPNTYSIVVHGQDGTTMRMGSKKTGKAKLTDPAVDAAAAIVPKKDVKPTTVPKDVTPIEPPAPSEPKPVAPPKKTTAEPPSSKGGDPLGTPEEGMKVVRESRDVITNSGRAKLRAFAMINQALKETGDFDVIVTVSDARLTVSSKPIDPKDVENVIMTTTMEALDAPVMPGQKPKKA